MKRLPRTWQLANIHGLIIKLSGGHFLNAQGLIDESTLLALEQFRLGKRNSGNRGNKPGICAARFLFAALHSATEGETTQSRRELKLG